MGQSNPPATQKPLLSKLESLPTEVLQSIFLHSLEINLPRASPYLSNALSNELLYTWLIRLAFSSTNPGSRTSDFFTPDFLPPYLNSRFWCLSEEERAELQTAILTCKWCTLPLIRKCQREYVYHAISRRCRYLTFSHSDKHILDTLDSFFDRPNDHDKAPEGRKGKGDIVILAQISDTAATDSESNIISDSTDANANANAKGIIIPATATELAADINTSTGSTATATATATGISSKPQTRKLAIWLNFGAIQIRKPQEVYYENNLYRLPASPTLHPARIPQKLLRAPWSASQFEFLQLLAPDFYLDEDELVAERSAAVTSRLIRRRNIGPFRRLLGMYFRAANCRVPARWPLLEEHFLLIVRCAGAGVDRVDPFAKVVLEERWGDIPVSVKGDLVRVGGG